MIKITKQNTKNFFKKILNYIKSAKLELIIIAAAIFVDLLSKFLIHTFMDLHQSVTLIPKFLHFTYTLNDKAAFNFDFFGLGTRWFFVVFVTIATSGFFAFLVHGRKNRRPFRISLALIVGGAIGNLYDRIVHAAVRDFIDFHYFGGTMFDSTSFPIFNLADSCLVIGVILFMVYVIFFYSKDEKAREEAKKAKEAAANVENENITVTPLKNENASNKNAETTDSVTETNKSDSEKKPETINSPDDETTVYAEVGPFFKEK